MPINNYGVLVCRAIAGKAEFGDDTPHYQVHAVAADTHYRLAINVRSREKNRATLLFLVVDPFEHPITSLLRSLNEGFTDLPSAPGGMALDYIRANLFDRTQMRLVENNTPVPITILMNSSHTMWSAPSQKPIQPSTASASAGILTLPTRRIKCSNLCRGVGYTTPT